MEEKKKENGKQTKALQINMTNCWEEFVLSFLVLSCRLIVWQNVTPELAGAVIMSVEMKMIQKAKAFTIASIEILFVPWERVER